MHSGGPILARGYSPRPRWPGTCGRSRWSPRLWPPPQPTLKNDRASPGQCGATVRARGAVTTLRNGAVVAGALFRLHRGHGGGEGKVPGKSRDVGDHRTDLSTVRWRRWHFQMVDGDDLGGVSAAQGERGARHARPK
jgi:hypothetical protein